jgi:hypothetical protein
MQGRKRVCLTCSEHDLDGHKKHYQVVRLRGIRNSAVTLTIRATRVALLMLLVLQWCSMATSTSTGLFSLTCDKANGVVLFMTSRERSKSLVTKQCTMLAAHCRWKPRRLHRYSACSLSMGHGEHTAGHWLIHLNPRGADQRLQLPLWRCHLPWHTGFSLVKF